MRAGCLISFQRFGGPGAHRRPGCEPISPFAPTDRCHDACGFVFCLRSCYSIGTPIEVTMTTEQLNTSHDNLRRLQIPVATRPEAEAGGARPQLGRGVSRLRPRDGDHRGGALHPLPDGALPGRLPDRQRHPGGAPPARGGRRLRRGGQVPRDEQPPRHVRPPLPAGIALRGRLRRRFRHPAGAVRQAAAGGDRQARGVHRRLRAAQRWRRDPADGAFDGPSASRSSAPVRRASRSRRS